MEDIDVILGFDMETDVGSFSPFYEGLTHGTPLILELLESQSVEATFFFTGEAAKLHPEVAQRIRRSGRNHEIGCHGLFHETYGDALFDIPGSKPLLPEEVENRIRISTEWVKSGSGVQPVSFRCPRLWGSTAVVAALEALDYAADASYPMYFYEKQLVPYHPSKMDWREKGAMKIVEIPNFADMMIESRDPLHRDRDQWPLFRTESAQALLRHIDSFVDHVRRKGLPATLCFYFHPWEFIRMPEKFDYGEATVIPHEMVTKNCGPYAVEQLGLVMAGLRKRGGVFKTCRQIAVEMAGATA
jgi:peptidoglycan-N-acetylglucosamine deacetylase